MIVSTYKCKKCNVEYEYIYVKGMKNAKGKKAYPLKRCIVCKQKGGLKEIKKLIAKEDQ